MYGVNNKPSVPTYIDQLLAQLQCILENYYFNNFVEKCKIEYLKKKKKKSNPSFPKFLVGRKRANKHLFFFFFLGLIKNHDSQISHLAQLLKQN